MKDYSEMQGQELVDFADSCHAYWMENVDFSILQHEMVLQLASLKLAIDEFFTGKDSVRQSETIIACLDWFKKNKETVKFKEQ